MILDDLRYARRALRAQAGFAAAVAVILAVAIGANSAVFALVDAALLSPLPFPDPSRLVAVEQTRADSRHEPLSIPDYRDLRDGTTRSFAGLAATFQWSANLTGGEAERVQGMKASASFFAILDARAALGRTLQPADETGSGARVAVLTHRFWLRRFGGSPSAVGATLILNGDPYTVVGILPPAFITPVRDADLVAPFPIDSDPRRAVRDSGFLKVTGRLRPGVTIERAQTELDAVMARLRLEYPATNATHLGTSVTEWRSTLAAPQRSVLLLLQAAVALVLLVACANVGNLFLAAAMRREHEFAVRAALGASGARRMRQVFLETAMIATAAGLGGLAVQALAERALSVLAPPDLLALSPPGASNPRVLGFTLAATLVATVLFGALPALRLGAPSSLRSRRGASPATRRLRGALVVTEVALASMLITVAVVLAQSFAHLQAVDPGFRTDHLLTARLSLPRSRFPRAADSARFVEALRPRLLALPGVDDAAAVNVIPLNGYRATADVWPAERPAPAAADRPQAQYRMISPSYVRTFGLPLIAGRSFEDHDAAGAEPVVLISRTLARRFWTVADAVGRTIVVDDAGAPRRARIVGVVGDVKHYGLDAEVTPDIYAPIAQVPDVTVQWLNNNMYWGLRTTGDPGALRDAFRRTLREVDADVPAAVVRTMDEALELALAPRRMNLWLVRVFAILALLLAGAGVYAVTSFSVALRRREIAIRAALGARPDQTVRAVVGDAARPIVLGLALGAAGALIAAPALRSVLFEVEPVAAGPFTIVAATLLAAGLTAAMAAAWPIRRIDPIEALKTES